MSNKKTSAKKSETATESDDVMVARELYTSKVEVTDAIAYILKAVLPDLDKGSHFMADLCAIHDDPDMADLGLRLSSIIFMSLDLCEHIKSYHKHLKNEQR